MNLVPVQPDEIGQYDISWHLQSFADRSKGRFSVQHFKDGIASGHYQVWLAMDEGIKGVALTQVAKDDLNTVMLTQCAGESRETWLFLMHNLMAWAKQRGSGRIEAICRMGWERDLKKFGFRKTHVVMELDT